MTDRNKIGETTKAIAEYLDELQKKDPSVTDGVVVCALARLIGHLIALEKNEEYRQDIYNSASEIIKQLGIVDVLKVRDDEENS